MIKFKLNIVIIIFLATVLYAQIEPSMPDSLDYCSKDNVSFISWENQIWKVGGGSDQIKIYSDGKNEITIESFGRKDKKKKSKLIKNGWQIIEPLSHKTIILKLNYLPESTARQIFNDLLSSKITDLKIQKACFVDGGGTVVGVKYPYLYTEKTIVSDCLDKNSTQYEIFKSCERIINMDQICNSINMELSGILKD